MTAQPEIQDRILTTANALVAEGIANPTNAQVRARLGGGSLSHISPVMRQWRTSRQAVTHAPAMPEELKTVLDSALSQLWSQANRIATQAVAHYRQEAQDALDTASGERDEALAEVTRLEGQVAELKTAVAGKDQALEKCNTELEATRSDHARLAAEQTALQTRLDERERELARCQAELKEAREDHRKLQGELVEIARKRGPR